MRGIILLLACTVVANPMTRAEDPPKPLSPDQRKELASRIDRLLYQTAVRSGEAGDIPGAAKAVQEAVACARQLYPKNEFPDGHEKLIEALRMLGFAYDKQGKPADAELIYRDALAMSRRLHKDDIPRMVTHLVIQAKIYSNRGKPDDAEPLLKEALGMRRRLFKGDHPEVAVGLRQLAGLYRILKRPGDAEPLLKEALGMRRRLHKGDHRDVADALSALADAYEELGRWADAKLLQKEALEMHRRLHAGDHPDVASSLSKLAYLNWRMGRSADAEPLLREALEMNRRLFKGDRPEVIVSLRELAGQYWLSKRPADASPLYEQALAMQRRLFKGDHPDVADTMNRLAGVYEELGKLADAESLYKEALAKYRRLYKGDHPTVAGTLYKLADVYREMGRPSDADPLYREFLGMRKRLIKGDEPNLLENIAGLGVVYQSWGWLADAELFCEEALAMCRRLYKGDHPRLAACMKDLAVLYRDEGRYAIAKPLLESALEMRKRLAKGDHEDVAETMSLLGSIYRLQGSRAEATKLLIDAFEMRKRLHKDLIHPAIAQIAMELATLYQNAPKPELPELLFRQAIEVYRRLGQTYLRSLAVGLHNLGGFYVYQGRLTDAEPLFKEALTISRRLYTGDHPDVAHSLQVLGLLYYFQREYIGAEKLLLDSLDMYRRLTTTFARAKSEGESLTLMSSLPNSRDPYLSVVCTRGAGAATDYNPATVYRAVWATKGTITRVSEERSLRVRAAANPRAAEMLEAASRARRRRTALILAPVSTDPNVIRRRDDELASCEKILSGIDRILAASLPGLARREKLDVATPADLQQALPADAVFVDYVRYTSSSVWDEKSPPGKQLKLTERYLAFVITKTKISGVDLDPAPKIERVIGQWREAITTPPHAVPAALPANVRELVWEPVRKHIPPGTKVVYVCPDADLTRLPWPALPGDMPGTILLEDFAVATVPHGPFLLDRLWPADEHSNSPPGLLAVGGVAFDGEPEEPDPGAVGVARRGPSTPPFDPKKGFGWTDLIGAKVEAEQVVKRAIAHGLKATLLTGRDASADRVLAALSKAQYVHFATHGFFADPQFRSILQLDPKLFETSRSDRERVGQGVLNPMIMSGLVFAGANLFGTPGRGIATGEDFIDRDLSGLELAVLSACETGTGDVAGGEGVYCLQRAFHVAGTRNVVASLWKVDDAATAALMGEFYRRLWDDKHPMPPVEALRQAQLEVYKANREQLAAMAMRNGLRDLAPGDKNFDSAKVLGNAPVSKDGRNSAFLWAAFTLSGPGR